MIMNEFQAKEEYGGIFEFVATVSLRLIDVAGYQCYKYSQLLTNFDLHFHKVHVSGLMEVGMPLVSSASVYACMMTPYIAEGVQQV